MSDNNNQGGNQIANQSQAQPPKNPLLERPRNPKLSTIIKKGGGKPYQSSKPEQIVEKKG